MQVTIEKIVYPGKSLATYQGKVCLTDEGLPGEIVEICTIKEKRNYVEGRTVGIIKTSEERVGSRCAHYKTCSPYQVIPYPRQIEIKKAQIEEILSAAIDLAEADFEFLPSPRIWNYRNRVRLHVVREGPKAAFAYHVPGRQDAYKEIQECYLISEPINLLLSDLLKILHERPMPSLKDVEVRHSRVRDKVLLSTFWKERPKTEDLDALIRELAPCHPLAGIVCFGPRKAGFQETSAWGENYLEENIGEARFEVGARSFFQVNTDILPQVIGDIMDKAGLGGEDRMADFYCGLGTFGVSLASCVNHVYGIESESANIEFLKRNLALNGVRNFTICEGLSQEWISWVLDRRVDVVFLDPPRKGLSPEILQALKRRPAARLVYLSCNPTTLARDLKELKSAYHLKSLRGYDFFPQTPHIETLAVLKKR